MKASIEFYSQEISNFLSLKFECKSEECSELSESIKPEGFESHLQFRKYDVELNESGWFTMCFCEGEKYKDKYFKEKQINSSLTQQITIVEQKLKTQQIDSRLKSVEEKIALINQNSKNNTEVLVVKRKYMKLKGLVDKILSEIETTYEWPIKGDKITNPVWTPNGVSYEHDYIMKYIKSSKKDPLTKKHLTPSKIIPNIAIKNVISIVNTYKSILKGIDDSKEYTEI